MVFRIERWSDRGVTSTEASTKREANRIAEAGRAENGVTQTIVIFPNGAVRVCRNTRKGQ